MRNRCRERSCYGHFLLPLRVQVLGIAANKFQLTREGVGFLKDPFTLSFYNVSADTTLSVRERGGRKK